ncbi:MAG: response regulator [Acidobacteria bacterium]|nr:response regulator [Acidobacteriota bacterium]NIM60884.1 response regulator [Acidobacteriota bacterium]NIO60418.1 response regulator [Acidobacteriota bacterium]NIQ31513.1 response regulator [Acidobacteriota bacterium]NIQ86749.1 response regulator [Acidobacteriota bacterium]
MDSAGTLTAKDTRRVLVVDDELSVREILCEGLEAFGFDTRMAADADEAMSLLENERFHLLLTDIDMPGRSGIDLMNSARTAFPDLDVVMVTGVVDAKTAIKAIRDGASDYVTKPFNLEEVQIVVDRTLEKRRLIEENRSYQEHLEDLVELRTGELVEKHREVEHLYDDLQDSYESTLQALVTALDFRDNETQGHSYRVVEYAVIVAKEMGIEEPELTWIRRGAILHDVGKIGIPDSILKKPGKLDEAEWEEMKRHPEMGFRMLQHIRFLEPALDIVMSHQERFDGTGYPRGLQGEEIPLGARIFAVVDTFDAMTSDRPYRKALTIEDARSEIREWSGRQFDPDVAEAFLQVPAETWREVRERVHREVTALEEQVRQVLGS